MGPPQSWAIATCTMSPPIISRIVKMSLGFDHCPRSQADVPSKPLEAILMGFGKVAVVDERAFRLKFTVGSRCCIFS